MNITFTDDNGTQTRIEAKPDTVAAEARCGKVCVSISWDREYLAVNDPDGYKALQGAFPGHGALTLDHEDQQPPQNPGTPGDPQPLPENEPLFQGAVAGVSIGGLTLSLSAHSDNGQDNDGGEPDADTPTITITPNAADTSGLTVDITVDNTGQGPGSLDLGDDSPTQNNPGDATTVTTHAYTAAGTYNVTFTDADDASRTASADVTIPATA